MGWVDLKGHWKAQRGREEMAVSEQRVKSKNVNMIEDDDDDDEW